jgi:hypothetical protein
VRGLADPGLLGQDPATPAESGWRPPGHAALYRIVIARLRHDQQTRDYLDRRIREGKSKKEAIRCLIG